MRNTALLEATMTQIADHPELHDQSWYFTKTDCGTAACFAGWACVMAGLTPKFYSDLPHALVEPGEFFNNSALVEHPDGNLGSAQEEATLLLGLSFDESRTLFDAGNTRRMLELMTKALVNGEELKDCDHYRKEVRK